MLRFITAGSVDDGKSTLIGRLLFDAKAVLSDQVQALQNARNARVAEGEIDFSFLTDGLESEREQGITIDVAYRYFSTPRRSFIVADCPGHEQYTRNMITGASTADAVIILIDATRVIHGELLVQTRRHTALALMLGIQNVVVAVNKMDLVGYGQEHFEAIAQAYRTLYAGLGGVGSPHILPVSALRGENLLVPPTQMPWYSGPQLLPLLESLPGQAEQTRTSQPTRLPVQLVVRSDGHKADDFRGYAGRLASGSLRQGQTIRLLPSGHEAKINQLRVHGEEATQAVAGESVMVVLDRDVDCARGDVLVDAADAAAPARSLEADLAWMDASAMVPGRRYLMRQACADIPAKLQVLNRLDLRSLERTPHTDGLQMNDVGRVRVQCARPALPDLYHELPRTGSFILIDEATNQTAAAGMIRSVAG